MRNVSGFVVLFLASVGIAAAICASVRKSLVDLLDEVARLPAATAFYSRLFLICIFFMALSTAVGTTFNLKADAAFPKCSGTSPPLHFSGRSSRLSRAALPFSGY